MALSEYEKQVLEQMEAEFRRADPQLVSDMAKAAAPKAPKASLAPRRIAMGLVIALAGLLVLIGAVSLGYSLLSILCGVLGFALMVGGIWLAVSPRVSAKSAKRVSRSTKKAQPKGLAGVWARFMDSQERRWDDRRNA